MRPDIVMTASFWEALRRHLLREPHGRFHAVDEQLAFILASNNISPSGGFRLVAREFIPAESDDFLHRSPGGLAPTSEFVFKALDRCQREGWSLIEVHSHPFDRSLSTTFSGIDWGSDREKMPSIAPLMDPPFIHATMVMGHKSLDAHYYEPQSGKILPIKQVVVVGAGQESAGPYQSFPTTWMRQEREYLSRYAVEQQAEAYDRQVRFWGAEGQQRLAAATVAIVGLGGLGSFVALQLAHLGVGHLMLIDPDSVETTNLNRLIGATPADVGQPKVDVYKRLIAALSPAAEVTACAVPVWEEEALTHAKSADLLLGCVDNHGARLILNQLAVQYLIPLVDGGSGIEPASQTAPAAAGGQVHVVLPGSGCLECRGFIDRTRAAADLAPEEIRALERERGYGTDEVAPAVIFLNGVVASLQVAEAVFLLTGPVGPDHRTPQTSVYNALEREMLPVTQPSDECLTCGEEGAQAYGDLAPIRRAVFKQDDWPLPDLPELAAADAAPAEAPESGEQPLENGAAEPPTGQEGGEAPAPEEAGVLQEAAERNLAGAEVITTEQAAVTEAAEKTEGLQEGQDKRSALLGPQVLVPLSLVILAALLILLLFFLMPR